MHWMGSNAPNDRRSNALNAACPGFGLLTVGHAEGVTDLEAWVNRVRHSTDRLLEGFEDRFGYPPDRNVVVLALGRGGSRLSEDLKPDAVAPPAVVEFFDAVGEVRLPDVWNGYFIGPVSRVIATYADRAPRWLKLHGRQVEILVIGSDGGGALYVVGTGEDGGVLRVEEGAITDGVLGAATDDQLRELSTTFAGFLELWACELESFAAGSATPSF